MLPEVYDEETILLVQRAAVVDVKEGEGEEERARSPISMGTEHGV